jgi:hypothetical protein
MLPFLGRGARGAERGVKLALIGMKLAEQLLLQCMHQLILPGPAGIKEGLYDSEALAAYLLYRLNALDGTGTSIVYLNYIVVDFVSPHSCALSRVKRPHLSDAVSAGDNADR